LPPTRSTFSPSSRFGLKKFVQALPVAGSSSLLRSRRPESGFVGPASRTLPSGMVNRCG
jgi:hypothetical protein